MEEQEKREKQKTYFKLKIQGLRGIFELHIYSSGYTRKARKLRQSQNRTFWLSHAVYNTFLTVIYTVVDIQEIFTEMLQNWLKPSVICRIKTILEF